MHLGTHLHDDRHKEARREHKLAIYDMQKQDWREVQLLDQVPEIKHAALLCAHCDKRAIFVRMSASLYYDAEAVGSGPLWPYPAAHICLYLS